MLRLGGKLIRHQRLPWWRREGLQWLSSHLTSVCHRFPEEEPRSLLTGGWRGYQRWKRGLGEGTAICGCCLPAAWKTWGSSLSLPPSLTPERLSRGLWRRKPDQPGDQDRGAGLATYLLNCLLSRWQWQNKPNCHQRPREHMGLSSHKLVTQGEKPSICSRPSVCYRQRDTL